MAPIKKSQDGPGRAGRTRQPPPDRHGPHSQSRAGMKKPAAERGGTRQRAIRPAAHDATVCRGNEGDGSADDRR